MILLEYTEAFSVLNFVQFDFRPQQNILVGFSFLFWSAAWPCGKLHTPCSEATILDVDHRVLNPIQGFFSPLFHTLFTVLSLCKRAMNVKTLKQIFH